MADIIVELKVASIPEYFCIVGHGVSQSPYVMETSQKITLIRWICVSNWRESRVQWVAYFFCITHK